MNSFHIPEKLFTKKQALLKSKGQINIQCQKYQLYTIMERIEKIRNFYC